MDSVPVLPPILVDLPEVVARLPAPRSLRRGQPLFLEGDTGEGMWYIASGWVKIAKGFPSGQEQILWIKRDGDYAAEVVLQREAAVYPATATALSPVQAVMIPRSVWQDLVSACPELSGRLANVLAEELAVAQERLRDNVGPIPVRILRLLLHLAVLPEQTTCPLTHEDVAGLIGASRERVSRALSGLRQEGVLTGRNGHLVFDPREVESVLTRESFAR